MDKTENKVKLSVRISEKNAFTMTLTGEGDNPLTFEILSSFVPPFDSIVKFKGRKARVHYVLYNLDDDIISVHCTDL